MAVSHARTIPLTTAAALLAHRLILANSSGQAAYMGTTAGTFPIGVTERDWASGVTATILMLDSGETVKVSVSGTITAGSPQALYPAASGQVSTTASAYGIVGYYIGTSNVTTGEVVEMLVAMREQAGNALWLLDAETLGFGTGAASVPDVLMQWDGANFIVAALTDDALIEIGDSAATQKSFDVKIYGNAASGVDFLYWDASDSALEFNGAARLDFSSVNVAAANTDGGIIKGGTASARIVEDTADMRFINFNFDNGATSGDNRGMYLRLYLTGAGGGGEAARLFTTVEDVAAGTAHGAHISLGFAASGSITGLGVASRNTLHIPNAVMPAGGTYAASQPEIYSDGATSSPSGVTELSFIRCTNDGNATGVAAVDDKAFLISLIGGAIGAGNVMAVKSAAAVSHTLRIKAPDGATYYLMVSDAQ